MARNSAPSKAVKAGMGPAAEKTAPEVDVLVEDGLRKVCTASAWP